MSNNVDNRVVNMQFNNAQFEAGVKQTITSLESLKEALKLNTAATGLSTIQSAVNSCSLANIETAVDNLAGKFSTLGIVGMTTISNLTNKAVNYVTSKLGSAYNTIVTGGWGRASRSAQARFTLEGILGTDEQGLAKVEEAFKSASNSVTDTAYTLDSAVSIASQLVTSGVDTGEQLEKTLTGLAGVAATTGANYEMLGNIWVDAAAAGRVTGDTLTRLTMQGLNASQYLADALGTTSENVRSMASKGEIDFNTFAEAMNDAFGAHAKDANKTFSGVTANIRAQLTKIGEIFSSGIIENDDLIDFLNEFRKKLGEVKTAIAKLQDTFKNLVTAAAKLAKGLMSKLNLTGIDTFIENVKWGMEQLTDYINSFIEVTDKISESSAVKAAEEVKEATSGILQVTEEQAKMAWEIWHLGNYGNGSDRIKALGDDYEYVQAYVNALKAANFDLEKVTISVGDTAEKSMEEVGTATAETNKEVVEANTNFEIMAGIIESIKTFGSGVSKIFSSIKMAASKVYSSIKKAFSWTDLIEDIAFIGTLFSQWAGYFEITEERGNKLERAFGGVWSAINIVKKIFKALATVFTNTFGPAASTVFDIILSIAATVGDAITKFDEWLDSNDKLTTAFGEIGSVIGSAIGFVKEFFEKLYNLPAVQELIDRLTNLASIIGDKLIGYFNDAKGAVGEFFSNLNSEDTSLADTVLGKINDALEKMIELFDDAKSGVTDFFGWFDEKEAKLEEAGISIGETSDKITEIKSKTKTLAKSDSLGAFAQNVSTVFKDSSENTENFFETLLKKIKSLDYVKLALVGFTGTLSAFLGASALFTFNLSKLVTKFTEFPGALLGVVKSIKTSIQDFGNNLKNQGRAKVIKAVALAIAVLAASLIAMTFVDADKLRSAAISLSILIGVLTIAMSVLTAVAGSTKNVRRADEALKAMGVTFVTFAAAVFILVMALKELTTINFDKSIIGPIATLIGIMASLVGVAALLAAWAPKLSQGGVFLILYAAAIWVMIKALSALSELDVSSLDDKMTALGESLAIIAVVGLILANTNFSTSLSVLVLILSIYTIEKMLKYIISDGVDLEDIKKNIGKFGTVLLSLAVIALYMYFVGKACQKASGVGWTILVTAAGIVLVTKALQEIADVPADRLKSSLSALKAIFGMFFVLLLGLRVAGASVQGAGKTLVAIAFAIGIMAVVVALISNIPGDQLAKGIIAISLITVLAGILVMCTSVAKSIDYKTIMSLVAVLATMTIVIALLSFVASLNPESYQTAVLSVIALLLTLGLSIFLLTENAGKINENNGKHFLKALYAMIIMMVVIAASLGMLAVAGKDNPQSVVNAAISICGVLATIAASMSLIFKTFKKYGNPTKTQREAIALMMIMLMDAAASISMLTYAMKGDYGAAIVAAGSIGLVLLAIAGTMYLINKLLTKNNFTKKQVQSTIIEMIVALFVISVSLSLLVTAMNGDYGAVTTAVMAIGVVLLTLAGVFYVISTMTATITVQSVVALGLMIAAILVIAASISLLLSGGYDWNQYKENAKGLLAVLTVLTAVIVVMSLLGKFAGVGVIIGVAALVATIATLAVSMQPIANGVRTFVDALEKLTTINWEALDLGKLTGLVLIFGLFGVAAVVAGAGLVVLSAGLMGVAAAFVVFSLGITLIAQGAAAVLTSLTGIALAIALLATTVETHSGSITDSLSELGTGMAKAIVGFVSTLAKNSAKISESLSTIVTIVINSIFDGITLLVELIGEGILTLLTVIEEKSTPITETCLKILVNVLKAIGEYSEVIGYYGAYIAVAFLTGVIKGLAIKAEDLFDAAGKLAVVAVASFANAVYEHEEGLIDAFSMLGMVLLRTLIDAFNIAGIFDSSLEEIDGKIEYQKAKLAENGYLSGESYPEEMATGIEDNKQVAVDAAKDVVTDATDQSDAAKDGAKSTTKEYTAELKNDLFNKAGGIKEEIGEYFNIDGSSIPTDGIISGFTGNINKGIKENKVDVSHIPASVREQLENEEGYSLSDDGKYLVKQVQSGIDESEIDFTTPYSDGESELFNMMDGTADDSKEKGENVGENYGEGIYNGMKTWEDSLYNESYHLGVKMEDGTREATDENSPSKKGFEIGKFWDIGIANGISAFASRVSDTTSAMATGIVTSTAAMMSLVSEIINSNTDLQPVIAPVVDTSSIDIASGSISALFGTSSLAANAALSVDNASENNLANQVGLLAKRVDDLANTDYSKLLEGVAINVDASTNVDGTSLRQTSSKYTIQQINDKRASYLMARGGRA